MTRIMTHQSGKRLITKVSLLTYNTLCTIETREITIGVVRCRKLPVEQVHVWRYIDKRGRLWILLKTTMGGSYKQLIIISSIHIKRLSHLSIKERRAFNMYAHRI
jgi:hypothetical protein